MNTKRPYSKCLFIPSILLGFSIVSGFILSSYNVFADNTDIVDEINITVPISCTLSGSGMTSHNASIPNGTYTPDIGTTTLTAFCNDNSGFSIYAAGYTGNEIGATNSNKLVGTSASNNATIDTGTATGPVSGNDTSNWAMKLTAFSSPTPTYPITITSDTSGSFSSYHAVPNEYTKVATRASGTDVGQNAEGSSLTTTYAAYISKIQAADTYSGQVKYTLVHPYDHATPIANPATLDTGQTVNFKLKSLADTSVIKSINVHMKTATPTGFTPSESNTISTSTSKKPIYIIFDNTNDAGIMHLYTEGDQIFLPTDSSYMFNQLYNLADLSAISSWNASNVTDMSHMFDDAASESTSAFSLNLSSWDTSNVTNMSNMFAGVGYAASTFSLDVSSWDTSNVTDMSYMFNAIGVNATTFALDLSSWDTSNVTDMSYMLLDAGASVSTWSIGDLSSWDTSNVTDMSYMFSMTGYSASTFTLDLSSWDTSNVTNMSNMFSEAGYNNATTFTLDLSSWDTSNVTNMSNMFSSAGYNNASTFTLDLSSWDTSNVTNMSYMFFNAGISASIWSAIIPQTNGNNISNTASRLYGETTSAYGTPPSGKSFTLAQP